MRTWRRSRAVLAASLTLTVAACSDADEPNGGGDCQPGASSPPVPIGTPTSVTIRVNDQRVGDLDFNGQFWTSEGEVSLPDGQYEATATLDEPETSTAEGTVLVLISGRRAAVTFTGPIACA